MENNKTIVFDNTVKDINDLKLKDNTRTVVVSKSGSGKSVLVKNLIYYFITTYNFSYCMLLSETGKFKDSDYKFLDKRFIMDFSEENLDKVIQYQRKEVMSNSKKDPAKCLLVLDDIKIGKVSQNLNLLFSQGRHYNITLICSLQFPRFVLSPLCRGNLSYLFVKELNNKILKSIVDEILVISGVDEKQIFDYVVNNNDGWKFILYNNCTGIEKKDRLSIIEAKLLDLKLLKNKNKK